MWKTFLIIHTSKGRFFDWFSHYFSYLPEYIDDIEYESSPGVIAHITLTRNCNINKDTGIIKFSGSYYFEKVEKKTIEPTWFNLSVEIAVLEIENTIIHVNCKYENRYFQTTLSNIFRRIPKEWKLENPDGILGFSQNNLIETIRYLKQEVKIQTTIRRFVEWFEEYFNDFQEAMDLMCKNENLEPVDLFCFRREKPIITINDEKAEISFYCDITFTNQKNGYSCVMDENSRITISLIQTEDNLLLARCKYGNFYHEPVLRAIFTKAKELWKITGGEELINHIEESRNSEQSSLETEQKELPYKQESNTSQCCVNLQNKESKYPISERENQINEACIEWVNRRMIYLGNKTMEDFLEDANNKGLYMTVSEFKGYLRKACEKGLIIKDKETGRFKPKTCS